ncbi:AraC family transcriptional regulator [Prevotella cerevisiae]|uniref:AraC family transcriptional regulator n=1 Tax=Segatella cerevisiae TaxID=2053716 RepID=A0ABT1BX57_9BACT|nr:helix-turn-helix domain-containing protein [Segatella cerevisiae]MCO6025651.1 AraC family transcriptional regulator [Segatella cerevisiae]
MKIQNLYQPYDIVSIHRTVHQDLFPSIKNTFYEMVFILEGKGIQYINDLSLPYAEDKLFLIFPQDTYGFEIKEDTTFFVLRFNRSFIDSGKEEWRQKLQYMFQHHHHLPGCILKNSADKPLVRSIAEALLRENEGKLIQRQEVIKQLIRCMITVAARNIELLNLPSDNGTAIYGITQILDYIHLNISNPENLKISIIAFHFNISETYFCEFFKKRTGQSPVQYISVYKLRLIERKLQFSDQRMIEIANSLGFSDASHFYHFFKKQTGLSPMEYKNRIKETDFQGALSLE